MYCTCSQQELYREVNRLTAARKGLAKGLAVRNFYTGERTVLDARQASRLLIILAADLMEQDAFFSMNLPLRCLSLAGPHLEVVPALWQRLQDAGVFELDQLRLEAIEAEASSLLRRSHRSCRLSERARAAHRAELERAADAAPWLYELSVEAARLGSAQVSAETYNWCVAWGTRWSCICSPNAAREYTCLCLEEGGVPSGSRQSSTVSNSIPTRPAHGTGGRRRPLARGKSPGRAREVELPSLRMCSGRE
jgi:hypothetical protein